MAISTRDAIRVLMTDVERPVTPSTLDTLRSAGDESFYIVGVDSQVGDLAAMSCDELVVTPSSKDDPAGFEDAIRTVVTEKCIDVVVPWKDDDALGIARFADDLRAMGTAVLTSQYDRMCAAVDNARMLSTLESSGITTPQYQTASTATDIIDAVRSLGYPETPVVVKPCRSSGGRGLWIVDAKVDRLQYHPVRAIPLEALSIILDAAEEPISEHVVMEYLPGDDLSVDVLADAGRTLAAIPRRRTETIMGVSHTGDVVADVNAQRLAVEAVAVFELHSVVNVQMRYSAANGGVPKIYEINPRVSGSIVANAGAGLDLLYWSIMTELGRKTLPENIAIRQTRMQRYWKEAFTHDGKTFSP